LTAMASGAKLQSRSRKTPYTTVGNLLIGSVIHFLMKRTEPDSFTFHEEGGLTLKFYEGTIADLNLMVEQNINWPEIYNLRGSAKDLTDDYNGAIEDYTKAINLNPDNPDYYT
jgi:tetratricopeptide (TPR) repeat protein